MERATSSAAEIVENAIHVESRRTLTIIP